MAPTAVASDLLSKHDSTMTRAHSSKRPVYHGHKTHSPGFTQVLQSSTRPHLGIAHRPYSIALEGHVRPTGLNAVPDPIPDTGFGSTQPLILEYPSFTTTPSQHGLTRPATISTNLDTPTPLLASQMSSVSELVASIAPPPPQDTTTPSSTLLASDYLVPSLMSPPQQHVSHKLSKPVVTVLGVAAGCLILGILLAIRVLSRPRPRPRPTLSLPILKDDYSEDTRFSKHDSPIFGGKEQPNARPGSVGTAWTWTQYPPPTLTKSYPSNPYLKYTDEVPTNQPTPNSLIRSGDIVQPDDEEPEKGRFPVPSYFSDFTSPASPRRSSMHQTQNRLSRATTRFSTASRSVYPASPISNHDAGVMLTADGHDVLRRIKSRMSLQRARNDSLDGGACDRGSLGTRYSQGIAYDGADVMTPVILQHNRQSSSHALATPPLGPLTAGRVRVKSSYYGPGAYPRMSSLPYFSSKGSGSSSETPHSSFEEQHFTPISKSESRRDRDTQALTDALGLSASTSDYPLPVSPQPTLYPDDSVSVVEAKRARRHSQKKLGVHNAGDTSIVALPILSSPPLDTGALGSLMLMDYGTTAPATKAIATTNQRGNNEELTRSPSVRNKMRTNGVDTNLLQVPNIKKAVRGRSDDKPPRVPSPPPMPSLSQMAMEHSDPTAYSEYRSPTYSIYGLYESTRRSRG